MSPGAEQLVVRQHERFHCRLPTHLRVADEALEQVTLSRAVGDGTGALDVFITDASRGGLGVESSVFFPRGCRMRVRPKGSAQAPEKDLIVRVQRVSMLDRKPTYYLGVSFVSKGPEHDQNVGVLLEMARRAQAAASAAPPSAALPSPASSSSAPHTLAVPPGAPPSAKGGG